MILTTWQRPTIVAPPPTVRRIGITEPTGGDSATRAENPLVLMSWVTVVAKSKIASTTNSAPQHLDLVLLADELDEV